MSYHIGRSTGRHPRDPFSLIYDNDTGDVSIQTGEDAAEVFHVDELIGTQWESSVRQLICEAFSRRWGPVKRDYEVEQQAKNERRAALLGATIT